MTEPRIHISVHANGCDFSIVHDGPTQWMRIGTIGSANGSVVFLDDADLTRLRDVIDAHLSQNTQQEAA